MKKNGKIKVLGIVLAVLLLLIGAVKAVFAWLNSRQLNSEDLEETPEESEETQGRLKVTEVYTLHKDNCTIWGSDVLETYEIITDIVMGISRDLEERGFISDNEVRRRLGIFGSTLGDRVGLLARSDGRRVLGIRYSGEVIYVEVYEC